MTMFLEKNMSGLDMVYRFDLTGLRQIIEKCALSTGRDVAPRPYGMFC
jgi:hypothetical protein